MDSPQQAIQTYGKLFQISNSFLNYWPKTEKYSNRQRVVNIDQNAMLYILMDLSCQALQTNEFFFPISNYWSKTENIFK